MKKATDIRINDKVWFAETDSIEYFECVVTKITTEIIEIRHFFIYKPSNGASYETSNCYVIPYNYKEEKYWHRRGVYNIDSNDRPLNRKGYIFYIESEARRYCKAHLMKEYYKLTDIAKNSFNKLMNMRKEHFDLLNNKYTERVIQDLELCEL